MWAADQAALVGAEIVVVHVISGIAELGYAATQVDPDSMRESAARRLEGEWTDPLRERKLEFRTTVEVGRVSDELMRVARVEDASLIVIGLTGRGTLAELVFGSVQHHLLRHAVRPGVAVPAVSESTE